MTIYRVICHEPDMVVSVLDVTLINRDPDPSSYKARVFPTHHLGSGPALIWPALPRELDQTDAER